MYQEPYHQNSIKDKRFLVTGGAGFIGSHIVEYLLKYGASKVRVLDNLVTGNLENLDQFRADTAFEFIEGDIRDYETCVKACEGIHLLSHQAALGSVPRSIENPVRTNAINVTGFLNMIEAARHSSIEKIVYASSSSVYGDEPNLPKIEERIGAQMSPYAVTKYNNELYASVFHKTYGMKILGLRYFNVFGPRQDPNGVYAAVVPIFADRIAHNKEVYIDGDGEQTRDFTFVENVVQANVRALLEAENPAFGQVYNIAYGERLSINQLYKHIQTAMASNMEARHRSARAGDIRNSLADTTKAREFLGYKPKFSFKEGIAQTLDYYS